VVEVKLISRKDKVLLRMSLSMDTLWSRNTVTIIWIFLDCISKGT